jgi:hypothetical protein
MCESVKIRRLFDGIYWAKGYNRVHSEPISEECEECEECEAYMNEPSQPTSYLFPSILTIVNHCYCMCGPSRREA